MANKVSLSSDGNPTPYTNRYPQPKSPGHLGNGKVSVSAETKEQMKPFLSIKNGSARPKGV